MRFERIGQGVLGVKIILDSDESELLYQRLSKKGSAEGRMLIAYLLAAAQKECSVSFSGGELNVEILDSPDGAVIYISEIKPYYYLSSRRGLRVKNKITRQLICKLNDVMKLRKFIKQIRAFCKEGIYSDMYAGENGYIIAFYGDMPPAPYPVLYELGVEHCLSFTPPSEEYEKILERNAVPTLAELLSERSCQPYHRRQKDSFPKQ